VIAEVYTLHAAIVAGVLLSLLAWRQTRRQRWFFAAIAVFAAGLGNHTTIVALATAPTDPPREPRSRAGDVYAASRATLAALRWTGCNAASMKAMCGRGLEARSVRRV
jgi:hypothetical protein